LSVVYALAALALGAAPASGDGLGLPESHSPNADAISTTYWVMIAITALVIIAVHAALIAALMRFRDRRGHEPARFAAGRGALRPVIAALSALALAIFIFGVIQTSDVREIEPTGSDGLTNAETAQVGVKGQLPASLLEGTESPTGEEGLSGEDATAGGPLEIDAIAQQWLWRFEYPGGQPGQRTFSYGELVVPVDTAVVLNITSTDVLHSWWVPALGGQVQATPGDVVQTWFKADEEGRYEGQSTTFSGTGFPAMRAWVRVVSPTAYQDYVEQLSSELSEAQGIIGKEGTQQEATVATP
ncbi:MAG TPA: cytochrome c oxidase subunit II, partial [Solirubrobacterales bacterium]|nr:cytochrome c oxidase subunit II [Solirubrobacterales bacterium]